MLDRSDISGSDSSSRERRIAEHAGAFAATVCAVVSALPATAEAAVPRDTLPQDGNARISVPLAHSADLIETMSAALGVETKTRPDHLVQWAQVSTPCTGGYSISPSYPSYGCENVTDVPAVNQSQIITNRVLTNVLLGGNEQINCSNCFSMFSSVGSFTAGAHGRYNLTKQLSVLGGIAFSRYDGKGYKSTSLPILAVALRYDLADLGWSRPYIDVGVTSSPSQDFRFKRNFVSINGNEVGIGKTNGHAIAAFAKLGWVFRATQRDEIAVYGELWRSWQRVSSFNEATTFSGPIFIPSTNDQMSIAKIGAQWTHLWGSTIETHFNGGIARTFGSSFGMAPALTGIGFPAAPVKERTYFEYGARVGYRVTQKMVIDVFANGAVIGGSIGNQVHVGTAVRYTF